MNDDKSGDLTEDEDLNKKLEVPMENLEDIPEEQIIKD